jgi:putative ABC transport system permease protein
MTIWRDLSLAARFLRRSPGFTIAAVLTVALSVGANATVFSLADVTLFRGLDVPDADRIVHVFERRADAEAYPLSYADYLDYRGSAQSFEALAAHYPTSPMHVLFDGEPQALTGAVVPADSSPLRKTRCRAGMPSP